MVCNMETNHNYSIIATCISLLALTNFVLFYILALQCDTEASQESADSDPEFSSAINSPNQQLPPAKKRKPDNVEE